MTVGGNVVYSRRRVRDRFLALLASDSVRNFIWLYYACFFAWGLFGTFYAYPIVLIVDQMSLWAYDVWVWMPLAATPVALGGLWLRHGGSPADQIHGNLLRRDFLGLWMQVGGHGAMSIVLGIYVVTGTLGMEPRQPIISVFLLFSYWVGVTFLCAQCWYKIRLGRPRS